MSANSVANNLAGVCGDWAIRRTQGRRLLVRHVCVVSRHDIAAIWAAFLSRCQRYRCWQGISFLGPIGCLLAIVYLPQPSANLVLGLILLTHFTAGESPTHSRHLGCILPRASDVTAVGRRQRGWQLLHRA